MNDIRSFAIGRGNERNPTPSQAERDRGRTWWLCSCGHGVDYSTYVNAGEGEICPNCAAKRIAALEAELAEVKKREYGLADAADSVLGQCFHITENLYGLPVCETTELRALLGMEDADGNA